MSSSDKSEVLRFRQALTEKRRVPCPLREARRKLPGPRQACSDPDPDPRLM